MHRGWHRHQRNPQREAAMLSHLLNLNAEQTSQIEPILATRDQKLSELRADRSLTPEVRRQQLRALAQETRQQFASVLTPEQVEQLRSMPRHGKHREVTPNAPTGA